MTEASSGLDLELKRYIRQTVILDTKSNFIYIGNLQSVTRNTLLLAEVDVHDCSESRTSRDLYILQSLEHGVRRNRKEVSVFTREVVSISLLADAVVY